MTDLTIDFVADVVKMVKPSATIAVSMKAAALKRAGNDVIGLGAGEPDFDTPDHIKAAAIAAISAGQTKYTAVDGTPELKQAIVEKFRRENNLTFDTSQVLVSCGAKHSIANLLNAVINPEDEVIIPAPYWVSYPDMVLLAGGQSVIIKTTQKDQFKITADQLKQAITDKTKLLILNTPSNPTGKAYTANELKALGELLLQYPQIMIATDDIYEHIYWGKQALTNLGVLFPELMDRMVFINGVSKAYAMTGWRIGYAAGSTNVIAAMRKIQSQNTSNPCSISQAASVAALNGDQSCLEPMKKAFKQRHDYLVKALNDIAGIDCIEGEGAFYAFPNVEQAMLKIEGVKDDVDFSTWLLENAQVAVVPGTPFGMPGHVRLSFATSLETLKRAINRINNAISRVN